MAGFSIVMLMMIFIVFVSLVFLVFFICSALGVAFGIVTLVKSNRFIKSGGRTNLLSAHKFKKATTVFFVICCIVVGLFLLLYLMMLSDPEVREGLEPASAIFSFFYIFGLEIACIVLKIISGKKYNEAVEYMQRLGNAGIYPQQQAPVYNAAPDNQFTTADVYCTNCGFRNNSINKFCVKCGEPLRK